MKRYYHFPAALVISMLTSSCIDLDFGGEIQTHTTVNSNGSLERTIAIESYDSIEITKNVFGVGKESGWDVEFRIDIDSSLFKTDTAAKICNTEVVEFRKQFVSVNEANKEMYEVSDTLNRIKSTFEKQFRWFYTYIKYSDTYINNICYRHLPPDSVFTPEDLMFFDRITTNKNGNMADSLSFILFGEKIEMYHHLASFEDNFANTLLILEKNGIGDVWIDSVRRSKEYLYEPFTKRDFDPSVLYVLLTDSLHIPVTFNEGDYDSFKKIEDREFTAVLGIYRLEKHSITMPSDIIHTNADSIAGSDAFWKNPGEKLFIKNYTMHAESRQTNYWAFVITVLALVLIPVWAIRAKRKSLRRKNVQIHF